MTTVPTSGGAVVVSRLRGVVLTVIVAVVAVTPNVSGLPDILIYSDSLQNGWADWSWGVGTIDLAASSPVHSGSCSISATLDNWEALYLHTSSMNSSGYTGLTFWINGGTAGGQSVQVQAVVGPDGQTPVYLPPLPTNSWTNVCLSLSSLGVENEPALNGFWIQILTSEAVPVFYVDDVTLLAEPDRPPGTTTVAVAVDAMLDRHPISPLIYGVCFGASNQLRRMNATLNRSGGNSTSRYNWLTNATNHASDWYFESLEESGAVPGGAADDFVRTSRDGYVPPMITVPINGWVAKLGPAGQRLCSFSVSKYGGQMDNDWEWFPDAGNGVSAGTGLPITDNDPTDANQPAGTNFQAGWIRHLTNTWASAANGGVRYYLMDNEWGLWHETHRDVWPVGVTMDQERDLFCEYAAMVKDVDTHAMILGPEEWGWTGYFYSGYDAQWGPAHGWVGPFPDRTAHGGAEMMPWWLNQVRLRSEAQGRRLLDVFTLHFYPQGGEFTADVSVATQLRRNRSTRALWDTNYVDESWIEDKVKLIPRMKEWVAANYPGTAIGITEYNWGAESNINGGTAQADILGILGREGVDLATRWTAPATNTPVERAFRMYRNFDGTNGCFGDISVRAEVPQPDEVSAFAAEQSDFGGLTVMVINKQPNDFALATIAVTNFVHPGMAQVWQMTSNGPIARLADLAVVSNKVTTVLPIQSVTLFLLPGRPVLDHARFSAADTFAFRLKGAAGLTYVTQASTDLVSWASVSTNTLASNSLSIAVASTNKLRFFRAQHGP